MKYEHTRIVTFKEDYYISAKGKDADGTPSKRLIYKKGSRHAIHKGVVKLLEDKKVKMEVEKFDPKPLEEKLKKARIEAKKKQIEVAYMQ